jgi:hypothetical protein
MVLVLMLILVLENEEEREEGGEQDTPQPLYLRHMLSTARAGADGGSTC